MKLPPPLLALDKLIDSAHLRPIAFRAIFAHICDDAAAGLMLSQAFYWSKRSMKGDGWFFKTQEEWQRETGLTRCEQETSRRKLGELGCLSEQKRGIPMRLWYRVDGDQVARLITLYLKEHPEAGQIPLSGMQETSSEECLQSAPESAGKQQVLIGRETSAKTTPSKTSTKNDLQPRREIDYTNYLAIWNDNCGKLPRATELTPERKAKLRARCKICGFEVRFAEAVRRAAENPFLTGEKGGGWRATFDWMTKNDTNYVAVLEGCYDSHKNSTGKGGAFHSTGGRAPKEATLVIS